MKSSVFKNCLDLSIYKLIKARARRNNNVMQAMKKNCRLTVWKLSQDDQHEHRDC